MKLVLFIDNKKADVMNLDFVCTNALTWQELFRNAIEKIKLENKTSILTAANWKLFVYRKSKMQ